ncbi:MAG TPA: aminotransferase class V-fold PLP-dependent enzyme [Chloroflexaceae bacterium]|nr:aminotransferase class V-fold PLP-dependent enzyme [Chloroflexaceae bacterium]
MTTRRQQIVCRVGAPAPRRPAPEAREPLESAVRRLVSAYPDYAKTSDLGVLRHREYGRLDEQGHVYLDYTGGGLYAESQLREHQALLREGVFGNPHSASPASAAATELVERTRATVLAYLGASPDEYAVIFTANASGALRLVGEAYPFQPGGRLLLSADNHNSVNGLREFARAEGALYRYAPLRGAEMRLDEPALEALLGEPAAGGERLFAYPAQSNFSGVQHPLEWVARARAMGWDVLLDAAAFLPTNRLDLGRWGPDFVTLSFYKLFGYPTGVGALVARREALAKLRRPWFAGGTIALASVAGDGHVLAEGEAAFEDGTVSYLAIPAVATGLRHLAAVGIETVSTRVRCLTGWLLDELRRLRHANGARLAQVHGPPDTTGRGGTVALTFCDPAGRPIDYRQVEQAAGAARISLRTGCFCNPGAAEHARGLGAAELAPWFRPGAPATLERFRAGLGERAPGAVRVSLGIVSNAADVCAFVQLARGFLDRSA